MADLVIKFADLASEPVGSGRDVDAEVLVSYTREVPLTDGTVLQPVPMRKQLGPGGTAIFEVTPSDSTSVIEDFRGFGLRVEWLMTHRGERARQAEKRRARTVKVLTADGATVQFGRLLPAEDVGPQYATVGELLGDVTAVYATVDNLSATATALPPGATPTVTVSGPVPNKVINIGVPRGADGAPGMGYEEGQQLLADSQQVVNASTALVGDYGDLVTRAENAEAAKLEVPDDNVSALVGNPATLTNAALNDYVGFRTPQSVAPVGDATRTTTVPASPMELWGGYVWGVGSSNMIRRSSDHGQTWSTYVTGPTPGVGPTSIQAMKRTSDNEVLVAHRKEIWKSSGFDGGSPTWTKVLDINGGPASYLLGWGLDGDGTKFIATEYGSPDPNWADSRYVWISTDAGTTWSVVYDAWDHTGNPAESHQHGCCYDPWADRFWFIQGHGSIMGMYWSDDDGTTWNPIPTPVAQHPSWAENWSGTTCTATEAGIIVGSDSRANGVHVIHRTADPNNQVQVWIGDLPSGTINWFAQRSWRDPETGIVYVGFNARTNGLDPLVMATDGYEAHVIYHPKHDGTLGNSFNNVIVSGGRLLMHMSNVSTPNEYHVASVEYGLPPNIDWGGLRGGNQLDENRTGVAAGYLSWAAFRGVAIGRGTIADGSSGTAIGWEASTTGNNSVAIGAGTQITTGSSVAIGNGAVTTGNNGTAVGHVASAATGGTAIGRGAQTAGGVAVGSNATVTGNNSVGIGASVTVTNTSSVVIGPASSVSGNNAVAIGNGASSGTGGLAIGFGAASTSSGVSLGNAAVAHSTSVALGNNTATTRNGQVAVGGRDIEFTTISDPSQPAAGNARMFARTNGGGKVEFCVRFPTGAIQVVAVEP